MKHIKLFEAYSEELYNRVLDLYNDKGLDGMTPEEIAYMKSGGNSEIPKSIKNKQFLDCPFILCIGEDIWKYYQDDLGINPDGNKDYEKDNEKINFVTFVVKNYEPIKIKEDEDWNWHMDHIRSGSDDYMDNYFHAYDTGLVFWSFDENYPEDLENWENFILNGGLSAQWNTWGEGVRSELGIEGGRGKDPEGYTNQIVNIDLKGKKLDPLILKKEIDMLKNSGKLYDWKNNIDITDDNVYPIYTKNLFKIIY